MRTKKHIIALAILGIMSFSGNSVNETNLNGKYFPKIDKNAITKLPSSR